MRCLHLVKLVYNSSSYCRSIDMPPFKDFMGNQIHKVIEPTIKFTSYHKILEEMQEEMRSIYKENKAAEDQQKNVDTKR